MGKKSLDKVTEYEKPGRVAAIANLTVEDMLLQRKEITVFSATDSKVALGKITVKSKFQDKHVINLADGQVDLDLDDSWGSWSSNRSDSPDFTMRRAQNGKCKYYNSELVKREGSL